MNQITKDTRVVALSEPSLTPGLKAVMEGFIDTSPNSRAIVTRQTDKDDAIALLPAYQRLCAAADRKVIDAWMRSLALAVANPPENEAFNGRMKVLLMALGDLPMGCWTQDTLNRAIGTFKFWPAVAEINDLLRPTCDRLRRTMRTLAKLANAELYVPARGVTHEQERAYVDDVASSRAAALREAGLAPDGSRLPPDGDHQVVPFPRQPAAPLKGDGSVRPAAEGIADAILTARRRLTDPNFVESEAIDPRRQPPAAE